jgi:hypothetical protein
MLGRGGNATIVASCARELSSRRISAMISAGVSTQTKFSFHKPPFTAHRPVHSFI